MHFHHKLVQKYSPECRKSSLRCSNISVRTPRPLLQMLELKLLLLIRIYESMPFIFHEQRPLEKSVHVSDLKANKDSSIIILCGKCKLLIIIVHHFAIVLLKCGSVYKCSFKFHNKSSAYRNATEIERNKSIIMRLGAVHDTFLLKSVGPKQSDDLFV